MAKRVLLLFAKEAAINRAADPQRLTDLVSQASGELEVQSGHFDDLEYILTNDKVEMFINDVLLDEFDAVYLRYWGIASAQSHALAVARYCKIKDIPFVDEEAFKIGSFNKINQYLNLYECQVPFPATVICSADRVIVHAEERLQYPFVLKDARGTRGDNNFLIRDRSELSDVISHHRDKTFVMQQYIDNDGDYRVFVTGDTVGLIIHRKSATGTYLNNTSKGGSATLVEESKVSKTMLDDALRAAKFFGRNIAGVDMVVASDGRHYCFEVNRAPQIEHSSFESEKAEVLGRYLSSIMRDK